MNTLLHLTSDWNVTVKVAINLHCVNDARILIGIMLNSDHRSQKDHISLRNCKLMPLRSIFTFYHREEVFVCPGGWEAAKVMFSEVFVCPHGGFHDVTSCRTPKDGIP